MTKDKQLQKEMFISSSANKIIFNVHFTQNINCLKIKSRKCQNIVFSSEIYAKMLMIFVRQYAHIM